MPPNKPVLAANIIFYQKLTGVKQKDLERTLGISRPTYRRKVYTNTLTVADLKILSRVLHTDINNLLKGV